MERTCSYCSKIDFNLSFAKKEFDEHFENNQIGVTTPIFKKSSKNFFSFTDSYLSKNKEGILQVSYNYSETTFQLQAIRKSIETASNIKDAKAYIIVNTGFINDLILKDFASVWLLTATMYIPLRKPAVVICMRPLPAC